MTPALFALPDLAGTLIDDVTLLGICSVRLFVVMSIFPPTADGLSQGVVRNAIVLLLSSYVAYGQPAGFAQTLHGAPLIVTGLRESVIGIVLGVAASTVFWAVEGAGCYIDDLTGYNNVQITNPARDEQSTPTALLLAHIATVAFWTLGGMTFLLDTLYESYRWWPIALASPRGPELLEAFAVHQTDSLMQMVAKLAAPMMLILLLIDCAFGFAAKSASKLDFMGLSQPVKGAMTVLMLALFVGMFVDQAREQVTLSTLSAQFRGWPHPSPTVEKH
ncbi:type III secretion system export apparatus subunit SctT [Burkholderia oklahomensis]|uniref:Type III secretion apparatus protein SpaR/YscT/HrcT n=1 Tax=Burkholderia oklahomensis TaxID=342113 RepID=A0AAI8BAN2_9BURK|nr:type III secretion system export apparatus subunit SctT [Burkholderia oklahomensis]AIO69318.1 type III secretion apparatus protein SpaR/YscT/HrcT [Burkholderia oklahomensis]AJX34479.1 type III secretion apparatus protein SpaR/YscT/HrcT [Burkholderia oklahomensis C6786]AOI39592.1 type III secretion system protein [Burkholderia oklahomensis EO147]AOI49272.1 type III secretion system protein [Burkholderia oklahomensis C6786]KUY51523.1 type III secretion system protein [Burkholderia oklahomensi